MTEIALYKTVEYDDNVDSARLSTLEAPGVGIKLNTSRFSSDNLEAPAVRNCSLFLTQLDANLIVSGLRIQVNKNKPGDSTYKELICQIYRGNNVEGHNGFKYVLITKRDKCLDSLNFQIATR